MSIHPSFTAPDISTQICAAEHGAKNTGFVALEICSGRQALLISFELLILLLVPFLMIIQLFKLTYLLAYLLTYLLAPWSTVLLV
jgi:hypothetical protein